MMRTDPSRHLNEEAAEKYSLGDVSKEEAALIEEHLLVCEACRNCVRQSDEFVRAMQVAGRGRRAERGVSEQRVPPPRWLLALGAAALLAVVVFLTFRAGQKPELAVPLALTRGDLMAHAPAGRPMALHPDLTGFPPASSYAAEIVDAGGAPVWRGVFSGPAATPPRKGTYFVRLRTADGELLREYGLTID